MGAAQADREVWATRLTGVRRATEALAEPLSAEDQQAQSMPDASPTKWHLAHTSWFFETFLLAPFDRAFSPFHESFSYLFNSYYDAVGARHARPERGLLTRPSLAEVNRYRAHVTRATTRLVLECDTPTFAHVQPILELGIAHEEQHQELLLMDVLHLFSRNALRPAYTQSASGHGDSHPNGWFDHPGGLVEIGARDGFAFDNERPRHRTWLAPFRLARRLVTNGEWRAFLDDHGYERPELWQSDGWDAVRVNRWIAPLYWEKRDGLWFEFTLGGLVPLAPSAPVAHVSWYEADAFARWSGARLPTEDEWEAVATDASIDGNFAESKAFRALPARDANASQTFGDLWEWTRSAHAPYPGFRAAPGAIGEYNGKFMVNQFVLRGGSFGSPRAHLRASYRNFFPPSARWAFSGVRLAEDA